MSERSHNFSAGPAILPEPVLKRAQGDIWDIEGTGIGIMEHSHRGGTFTKVLADAKAACRDLAGIGDDYEILFLQGGASTQFFMVPMNWLSMGQSADYINTGAWSKKAMKEAAHFGEVHEVASSADDNFSYIPEEATYSFSKSPRYLHFTSNNTIAGTQFRAEPKAPDRAFLVCDASSDIFSRPIDVSKYGVIYAGAQKNLGPSGLALVIVRKDLVEAGAEGLPSMLMYRTHAKADSCFNTPPTFGIYMMGEVFKWIQSQGGLADMAEHNRKKASVLYDFLDKSSLFSAGAKEGSRSDMNVVFRTGDDDKNADFIAKATKAGFPGLKGHRSVGGMRASLYNAFPTEGVEKLVDFMGEYEKSAS